MAVMEQAQQPDLTLARMLILDELFDLSLDQALREVTARKTLGGSMVRWLCG